MLDKAWLAFVTDVFASLIEFYSYCDVKCLKSCLNSVEMLCEHVVCHALAVFIFWCLYCDLFLSCYYLWDILSAGF